MKVSYNWITKYLKETKITPEELCEKLKLHLSDIESFENLKEKYSNLLIGEILSAKKHPNADKLGIYDVKIGESETVQVVAGDKKLKIGDKVVYLPIKSKIPYNPQPEKFDGIIRKTKIRGIESNGMLASEKELGISPEHDRVMTLDLNCKAGEDAATVLGLNDYIIEVENKTLTIRPDTFGIIGITRDISGFLNLAFKTPEWLKNYLEIKPPKLKKEKLPLKVLNQTKRFCPRYMAISMQNIEIKPSPLWLKIILSSIGIKPINNVVDITNYLMALTGQPLHAFDYDKVISKDFHYKDTAVITIRTAKQGEKITTIEQKTRELNEKTVLICDSQNPIAIGGIMGGLETEIDEKTKNIIIESANFDLYNIRKTSMSLGLVTDASTRFSKGQDPNLCEPVLYKAIELIKEICTGEIASNVQDSYIELPKPHKLTFSLEYFQKHIGLDLDRKKILNILANVEINEIPTNNAEYITVVIPTYRQDLKIAEDIHEEIARLYGYNKIPLTLPKRTIASTPSNPSIDFDTKLRNICKSAGLNELLTYSFIGQKLYEKCNLDIKNNYKLTNPLSPELEYLRTTLLPSLLEKVNTNINNGFEEFGIFEINKVHNKSDISKKEKLPIEHKLFSAVLIKNANDSYYQMKYCLDKILKELRAKEVAYESVCSIKLDSFPNHMKIILPMFDIHRTGVITTSVNKNKKIVGIIGEPNLDVQKKLKLIQSVGMFELDVKVLKTIAYYEKQRINYSKYPKITQDLCFIVNIDIPYIIVQEKVSEVLTKRKLNFTIQPVDIYQEKKDYEKKQVTLRITIQHKEKTLKEKDILTIREIIEKNINKELGGKLKSL